MQPSFSRRSLGFCVAVGMILVNPTIRLVAEEPAKQFLERMREEKLYDLAARYLEIYEAKGWLPNSMKADVKLERLMIIQDSLSSSRTGKERDDRLVALESGFRDFYDSSKGHARRSEAGLRLGNLSMDRGQRELKKLVDNPDKSAEPAIRDAARKAFSQAEKVFKSIQDDLAVLINNMAGAKIAANDTEKIALRNQYQGEYRQAQILYGLALKLVATSYPENSNEYKAGLKKADDALAYVITRATSATQIGAKTLSRLYRGDVLALMGKTEEALESYKPVADFDQDGIFRLWRVQATAAIVRLLNSSQGGNKVEEAVKRGSELLKSMAKDEQANAEWIDLQLAVAEAKLAFSTELTKKKANETMIKAERRDAREILQAIARRPGDHQLKAKKLLTDLGVDVVDVADIKLPPVKTFGEAFKEAKLRIERAESTQLAKEILNKRLAEVPDSEKPAIEAELKSVDETAARDRSQAMQLLQRALKLYRPEDARDDLLTARFYVAYLFIKQDRFWEAAAASDFVARSGPGTDTSLKACSFALFSLRKIMEGLPEDRQTKLMSSLEGLARYMIATWPQAEETQKATLTLLQNALRNQQWDEAEKFLEFMPKAAGQSNATRRDLGYVLWVQYLLSQDKERKEGNANPTGDMGLRDRAERLLKEGWENLDPTSLDQRAVEAGSALASLYLRTDRLAEAEAILKREKVGLLASLDADSNPIKEPSVKLEVLRLSLQSKVMAASAGGSGLDPKEVESLVASMRATASGNEKLLTNTLLTLAKDLREQVEHVANPNDQAKLAGGIQVLLTQLASVSDEAGILHWAGTTMWLLAKEINTAGPGAKTAKELNGEAAKVFDKILDKSAQDTTFLQGIQRTKDDILLGKAFALRGQGDHTQAADTLVEIIRSNNSKTMLTAQREAAQNYQEWSGKKDMDLLKKAAFGSEPDGRGKNTVWGWGKMSQQLSSQMGNNPPLQVIFFEARLQLATCRRLIALATPGGPDTKLLEQALGDVRQTYKVYPDLGGNDSTKKFDALTKQLQNDLGKPNVGLKEFN